MQDMTGFARPRWRRRSPIALAFALAGCAQASSPESIPAATAPQAHAEARICRPDAALLAPQSAPDCVFRRGDLKTADPDLWAKMKVEYERQCYQTAEKRVRERLGRLQAASRCEIEAANR
jgi:hypothetical protein